MSYLDQLREQAEQTRLETEKQKQITEKKLNQFEQLAKPCLDSMYDYMREFTAHMQTIHSDIHVSYSLPSVFRNENFKQDEFVLSRIDKDQRHFSLRVFYKASHPIRIDCQSHYEADKKQDILSRNNIPFTYQQYNNKKEQFANGIIELKGHIITEFKFAINHESLAMDISVRNFKDIGKRYYHLHPNEINQQFLDDFARYINHEVDDDFISEYQISGLLRHKELTQADRIRQKVVKQAVQRKKSQKNSILEQQRILAKNLQKELNPEDEPPVETPKKKWGLLNIFKK